MKLYVVVNYTVGEQNTVGRFLHELKYYTTNFRQLATQKSRILSLHRTR